MSKVKLVVLLIISCNFCRVQSDLCALSKSAGKCICEYGTNQVTNFPEQSADCKWNEMEDFPRMSEFPDDLNVLDFSHNNVRKLVDTSPTGSLKVLDLSYNDLSFVDFGFFQNFPNLETLNLSHNSLKSLKPDALSDLKQLRHLDLSFNQFSELPDGLFTKLSNLESLNLGYNPLGGFFGDNRRFFNSSLGVTKNLTYLNVDRIGLEDVDDGFFDGGDQVVYLSAADNNFQEIPSLPNALEYLDFSGNNLTMLKVSHLTYHSMKVLKLNRLYNLETIDKYAFYNMQHLEELYIENCPKLREFDTLAFGLLRENENLVLKKLVLARNGILKLNSTYFHLFKKMDFIDLQNNNFLCDCDILWLQLLNGSYYKQENMRCMLPTNLRNVKIMDLEERHLPMCLMSTQSIRLQKVLVPILAVAIILLLCSIVYLVYMGPYIHRNYRGIGPESPYQHTVLRETS